MICLFKGMVQISLRLEMRVFLYVNEGHTN